MDEVKHALRAISRLLERQSECYFVPILTGTAPDFITSLGADDDGPSLYRARIFSVPPHNRDLSLQFVIKALENASETPLRLEKCFQSLNKINIKRLQASSSFRTLVGLCGGVPRLLEYLTRAVASLLPDSGDLTEFVERKLVFNLLARLNTRYGPDAFNTFLHGE